MMNDGQQPTVLVADDDATVRLLARESLEQMGLAVLEASSGPEALAHILETRPRLILLDVIMPGMDGFDICARVRSARVRAAADRLAPRCDGPAALAAACRLVEQTARKDHGESKIGRGKRAAGTRRDG